jgi:hypothetical protein
MAEEMLCWPDATIDLPDRPIEAAMKIMDLASDGDFLSTTRSRNVIEMCRRHDWRYRMRDIYQYFQLKLPPLLTDELSALEGLADNFQLRARDR